MKHAHFVLGLIVPAAFLAFVGQARAQTLYGATTNGQLIEINASTGAGSLIGNIGFSTIEALEFMPNGSLLGIANANQLIQINLATGAGQLIGTVTGFAWVEALAAGSDGTLYGTATVGPQADANRLIRINPATGQPISIAPSTFGPNLGDVDGLAISSSGTILGSHINAPAPTLFSVDPATGLGTSIGTLSAAVVGLDFAPNGTLYGVTIPDIQIGGPSRLVTVNPSSGAVQDVGAIGFNTIQAIAFVPETSTILFAVSCALVLVSRRNRIHQSA